MSYVNASTLHGPAMRVSADFSVCTFKGCHADPMEGLSAPLCAPHAKIITVQVLAMNEPAPRLDPVKTPKLAPTPGNVYIVQHGNRVKIGFSKQVKIRLKEIPHDTVLAIVPGDRRLEFAFHRKFQSIRTTGEWFEAHPELIAFAENLAKKAA